MQDLEIEMLAGIVKYLVENEDEIRIQKNEEADGSTNLILTTHKDDIGRVIGKEGKVVGAMRTLLRVIGAKLDKKITLSVVEPDKI